MWGIKPDRNTDQLRFYLTCLRFLNVWFISKLVLVDVVFFGTSRSFDALDHNILHHKFINTVTEMEIP